MRLFLSVSVVILSRIFISPAYAGSNSCYYDKTNQEFHGQDGKVMQLNFALHAHPAASQIFWDSITDPTTNMSEPARKLIEANSGQNEELRLKTLNLYKKIKGGSLKWVGFEGSEVQKNQLGGTLGKMNLIARTERDLTRSGLSKSDVERALIDLYGDEYAYYLWFKDQPNPEKAVNEIQLVGIDNNRNSKVDILNAQMVKLNLISVDRLAAIKSLPQTGVNQALLTKLYSRKHSVDHLESLLKSSEAASATPELRQAISDYLKAIRECVFKRKETADAEATEFKVRNFAMAQDSFANLVENGKGYSSIGSAHQEGMLEYLVQTCKNHRGNTLPSEGLKSNSHSSAN